MIAIARQEPKKKRKRRPNKYLLDGIVPYPVENLFEWATGFEEMDVQVGDMQLCDVRVSTVFLGLAYSFLNSGPPLLFETMIFGGVYDQQQWRTSTWRAAEQCHERAVEAVRLSQQ